MAVTVYIESLKKFHRFRSVWEPLTVLKMTGCFVVISEAVVLTRLKDDFYRKFLSKILPLLVKLYH